MILYKSDMFKNTIFQYLFNNINDSQYFYHGNIILILIFVLCSLQSSRAGKANKQTWVSVSICLPPRQMSGIL